MTTGTLTVTTPSDREICMTRAFDAPRDLVFDALTRPELLKRWLGVQNGWTLEVCTIDLRVGGSYLYDWRRGTKQMIMRGTYREIVRPARIVTTEQFDDPWYEGEAISTLTLTADGNRTTMATTVCYDTRAIRDNVLKSGMERGVATSYDRLDEVLRSSAPVR